MDKVKEYRVKSGLSKKAMSVLLQITEEQYELYERNPLIIPARIALLISLIFGKNVGEIFLIENSTKC